MNANGEMIDEVTLTESMHFVEDDTKGHSLEKYHNGWTSCIAEGRATPGSFSDITEKHIDFVLNDELIYDINDNEFILNLAIDNVDAMVSVFLYDRQGRKVEDLLISTRLVHNEIVLRPNVRSVGFYTLFFEKVSSEGVVSVYKKPLVVKK